MSNMTMRSFVKKTAKRNDIKLTRYNYTDAEGRTKQISQIDDVAFMLSGQTSAITPATCLQAINHYLNN